MFVTVPMTREQAKRRALELLSQVRTYRSMVRQGEGGGADEAADEAWRSYCHYARFVRGIGPEIYYEAIR